MQENQFDQAVLRAIEKWPDVPACYDWLSLDRRGNWLIKGAQITHRGALDFINRHYAVDQHGRWYVQNGPQTVYCALEYTPWIYRVAPDQTITTHTALSTTQLRHFAVDDEGNLLAITERGVGLIDDRDLPFTIDHLQTVSTNDVALEDLLNFDFHTNQASGNVRYKVQFGSKLVSIGAQQRATTPAAYEFDPAPKA